MKSEFLYDYANLLERVFSVGYKYGFSTQMIEKAVAYSAFFQAIEKEDNRHSPIIAEKTLINQIYSDSLIDINETPTYNQCMWAAESYLRIQKETKLTLESIFLYIPLNKMYEYFPLYHEMDFNQIIDEFKRLHSLKSILSILLTNYGYSLAYISKETGISYNNLYSYKERRRDIKKMNAKDAYLLSNVLKVRIETLLELEI